MTLMMIQTTLTIQMATARTMHLFATKEAPIKIATGLEKNQEESRNYAPGNPKARKSLNPAQ